MRRDEFDHVIRAAGRIIGRDEVVVIGSQAILGAVDDPTRLPEPLTRSIEVDLLPIPDPDAQCRSSRTTSTGTSAETSESQDPRASKSRYRSVSGSERKGSGRPGTRSGRSGTSRVSSPGNRPRHGSGAWVT
jgi:hypothetical protein